IPQVYYDTDSVQVRPKSLPTLDSLAYLLIHNKDVRVEIRSHTDQKASEEYNMKLSRKRAQNILQYLIFKGVYPEQLTSQGYGESLPIIPNPQTEEDFAANRRTEFKILNYNREKFILRDQSEEEIKSEKNSEE
ncbi:MAG: OmpA family protein, partial [Cytophagales bacterium]|nr:OmpA family protein [Cytophagales bacterium]